MALELTQGKPITIKRKSDDGYRNITIRVPEGILKQLDKLANEANCSRNEIVNVILQHGIKNVEID